MKAIRYFPSLTTSLSLSSLFSLETVFSLSLHIFLLGFQSPIAAAVEILGKLLRFHPSNVLQSDPSSDCLSRSSRSIIVDSPNLTVSIYPDL
ncbi:hypothetical protein Bca4012_010807 [Brassica carinata]